MYNYQQIIHVLRTSYSRENAVRRDLSEKQPWKVTERQQYLTLLHQEGKKTLLEIGAGTGADSLFFQNNGLQVICTDLSHDMVELCREKGLEAYEMDCLSLDFPPASFDALFALNCLLHVPTNELSTVLSKLKELLCPGGLFYLGVYGGAEEEGIHEYDEHYPPRFFAHHTDEFMLQITTRFFDLISFKVIPLENKLWRFQSMTLRRKEI